MRRSAVRAWLALLLALALLPCAARAAEALLSELEQRLAQGDADSVNSHLAAHWDTAMAALNRKTAACELQAVSLSMRLARSANERAVLAHGESLRAASGRCARFILALAAPGEIGSYCASVASWGAAQTARELRRRIKDIDSDEHLRGNRLGQACRAAYVHELETTRVVLKVAPR